MSWLLAVIVSCSLTACVDDHTDASGNADTDSLTTTCVNVTNAGLIETNPAVVTESAFSLHKVFDKIRLSTPAGVTIPSSATSMFQEIYAAFANCTSSATMDPNHYGIECRGSEASFATLDPFTTTAGALHYTPVALVNRFDLAPSDSSYCGESRIVYWKTSGGGANFGTRAAIILELRMPAVALANGTKTCAPIAQFWANLSNVTDPTTRTKRLESFYFNGLAGMPFPPASAHGAGFGGAGQVRLNSFISLMEWNLREFKWQKVCTTSGTTTTCSAHFVEQTVKNNPSQLLFTGAHAKAPSFQSWFVNTATPQLAAATDINAIALGDAEQFNTFESVSFTTAAPADVNYATDASTTLSNQIQAKLSALGSTLTATNILDRAETQACAGCHQLRNGADLGGGLVWPTSGQFVQIDEHGTLSPALQLQFLPHRLNVLKSFVCGTTRTTSDPDMTIDGVPSGAAN
jgi:hypothetical protein